MTKPEAQTHIINKLEKRTSEKVWLNNNKNNT